MDDLGRQPTIFGNTHLYLTTWTLQLGSFQLLNFFAPYKTWRISLPDRSMTSSSETHSFQPPVSTMDWKWPQFSCQAQAQRKCVAKIVGFLGSNGSFKTCFLQISNIASALKKSSILVKGGKHGPSGMSVLLIVGRPSKKEALSTVFYINI